MLSRSMSIVLTVALFLAQGAHALSSDAPEIAVESKFTSRDVEVRLRDGSVLRGELSGPESISLTTSYGELSFPLENMLRLKAAQRMPAQDLIAIAAAIKELDSDEFAHRAEAQKILEGFGPSAAAILKEAREHASAEAYTRIGAVLNRIAEKDSRKLQLEDVVKSDEFEAQGALKADVFKLKHKLGDLEVKRDDVDVIRWLGKGNTRNLELEVNIAMKQWTDTGLDSMPGEKFAIVATGTINPFGSSNITGPAGSANWGDATPLTGALIGRFGPGGNPFIIGAGKQWRTDKKERLYLKIQCTEKIAAQNRRPSQGHFKIRMATGTWADDIAKTSGEAPADSTQPNGTELQIED